MPDHPDHAAAIRALIAEVTTATPSPLAFTEIRARAVLADGAAGLVTGPNQSAVPLSPVGSTRRRSARPLVAAAAAVVVIGCAALGLAAARRGASDGIDLSADGGPVASADAERIAFNCIYWVQLPIEGSEETAGTFRERTCSVAANGEGLTVGDTSVGVLFGPVPSPDGRYQVTVPLDGLGRYLVHDIDGIEIASIGADSNEPAWTPDSRSIVYSRSARFVVIAPIDGSPPTTIDLGANVRGVGPARISPDGTHLAVRVLPVDETATGSGPTGPVAVVDLTNREVTMLGGLADSGSVGWSPDSSRLAVTTSAGLMVIDMSRADPTITTLAPPAGTAPFGVAWSPDGATIAYVYDVTLSLVDVTNGTVRPVDLGQRNAVSGDPAWSERTGRLVIGASAQDQDASFGHDVPRIDVLIVDPVALTVSVATVTADGPDYVGASYPTWVPGT